MEFQLFKKDGLSVLALLISLLTTGVYFYQTSLIRKTQYMSVYPYLQVGNTYTGTLKYSLIMKNKGVGPAIIDSIYIKDGSGKVYSNLVEYVDEKLPEKDTILYTHDSLYKGQFVQPGESLNLIQLLHEELIADMQLEDELGGFRNDIDGSWTLRDVLNHDSLVIKVIYKSIYDQKWMIDWESPVPIEL